MKYKSVFKILYSLILLITLTSIVILPGATSAQETTIVTVSTPSEVDTSQQFAVNISIAPVTAIAGVQFNLSFDQSLLMADSVTEGNLLSQGGASTYFNPGTINNTNGTINGVIGAITSTGQTISMAGTFATIYLTAKTTTGTCPLTLSGVIVGDQNGQSVSVSTIDSQLIINNNGSTNHRPVLNSIGDKSVYEENLLEFTIFATDTDGDTLTFSASNLPPGAVFNPETLKFSWIPKHDQVGEYCDIHIEVFDGELSDFKDINVTVLNTHEDSQDMIPPVIQEITTSHIDTDSALINWTTAEPSTSQVEYWASPSQFSPLDETLVTEHEVLLTGLSPDTEYQYRTISQDKAGNLYISPVYDFATTKQHATFSTNWLTISPAEAVIGQEVTISMLITNTSNIIGSYDVTLSIDGVVEKTENVVNLDGGASQEVTFTIIMEAAGVYDLSINGTVYKLIVNDLEEVEKAIEVFSITPNYESDTGVITYARVDYGIYESLYSRLFSQQNTNLILKINLDDSYFEEVTLITSEQLDQEMNSCSLNYIPAEGWTSGMYNFQVELINDEEVIETSTLISLIIPPTAAANVVSWAILGEVIAGILAVIMLVVMLMLHHSRDMLRD